MNDHLIDILTAKAITTTGNIYVTLIVKTQTWNISNRPPYGAIRIDRNDLKRSVAREVNELSKLLPIAHRHNN